MVIKKILKKSLLKRKTNKSKIKYLFLKRIAMRF